MGKLILVGTPIGNLEDITIRAMQTLLQADYIVCEDTRRTGQLLHLLRERFSKFIESATQPRLISYRDQNHDRSVAGILSLLAERDVLLVSDSGMPAISDPGFKLIRAAYAAGFVVDVIPGATAATTALAVSGLPTDKFFFIGFLPRVKGQVQKQLTSYSELPATLVIYEAPQRVKSLLELIGKLLPEREVVLLCELTKLHQRRYSGLAADIIAQLGKANIHGECVLLIAKA
jgi:16S rRNA (cytidine1402-2'-O)-methyltransferase